MLVTDQWLTSTGATFSPQGGISGAAHLTHYTVEYRIWGEGEPIVLVPGLAGGIGLLGPIAKVLSRTHKVICYQLRGEDDCFAIRRPFGLRDLVGDLREFLDALAIETPSLLGVSFGGIIGLEFAARFPGRIGNLIVQGAGSRFMPGMLQQIAGTILNRFPLPIDSPFVNQFFNLLIGRAQPAGPMLDFVTRQIWSTDQSVMAHRLQILESFDVQDRLNSIRVPTLVVSGEKDLLVPKRNLRQFCEGLPNGQLVRIDNAGHLAFVTHPERVADYVQQFLA